MIALALTMLLASFCARGADSPQLAELLKKGEAAIKATNWAEAKPIFQKAVSLDPKNKEAQLSLGRCFYRTGKYEDALDCAKIAVALDPTNSEAIHLLGGCYYELTNYTNAADAFKKWSSMEPTNFSSWYWLGRSLFSCDLTNYTEAVEAFRKCSRMEPTNFHSWYWLGRSLLSCNLTNYAEATDAFRKCTAIEPTNYYSWYWLGRSLTADGHDKESLAAFKSALKIKPGDPYATYWLGIAFYHEKQYEKAAEALQHVVKIQPEFDSYYWLGSALYAVDRYKEAIASFQSALKIRPAEPDTLYWLGLSFFYDRQLEPAVETLQQAVKIKPEEFSYHYQLAYALWKLNRDKDALGEFQAAGRLKPRSFNCHFNPGLILMGLQRFPEAVPELEKAHELRPNHQAAKISLMGAFLLTSQYEKAASLFPTIFALAAGGLALSYGCGLLALLVASFRKRVATAPGFIFTVSWFVVFFEGQIAGVLLAGIFLPAYKMAVMLNAALWVCALPVAFAAFAGFPRQPWGEPFYLRFPALKTIGLCILAAMFLGLFDSAFEHMAGWLFGKPLSDQFIVPFLKEAFADAPWLTAIAVIVLSPVAEEILFRGLLYGALAKWLKPAWVIVITSIAFALVHMQIVYFLPLFVVGLVLGYARHKTGSLTASILIHGINNGLALLALKFWGGS